MPMTLSLTYFMDGLPFKNFYSKAKLAPDLVEKPPTAKYILGENFVKRNTRYTAMNIPFQFF